MILRYIYIVFIGVLLATFVGVGIAAFYPGPKQPEPPSLLKYCSLETAKGEKLSQEFKTEQEKFDKEVKIYEEKDQRYSRNVSIISLSAAIIILITSLTLLSKIYLIADGVLLGGVLTLFYSLIRGFNSQDEMFRFIVVSVGLVVSLTLGYLKFIKPPKKK